jgi:hypothetical protein
MKQLQLLKNEPSAYGGELLKTRKGRARPRPLDTRHTMHLVLRSSKAKGAWSFKQPKNARKIRAILSRFSNRFGVRILSSANVGNHLHIQIKLSNRFTYRPFIRAITAAIAMAVTGTSRWKPLKKENKDRFWDYRPFTRVVQGFRAFLNLHDYVRINKMEGFGYRREIARWIVAQDRIRRDTS